MKSIKLIGTAGRRVALTPLCAAAVVVGILLSAPPAMAQDTGTDPRDFKPKFMPYYRYTELENGVENDALTLFGLYAFTGKFAMTYEIPVGYKLDVSDTPLNNGVSVTSSL